MAKRLARPGLRECGSEAAQGDLAREPLELRFELVELHYAIGQPGALAAQRSTRHREDPPQVRRAQEGFENVTPHEAAGPGE